MKKNMMRARKQQLATEYAKVNANPFLKAFIQLSVMLIDLAFMLLIIWNAFMMFFPYGSWFNFVDGKSMDPTLHHGQVMFTDSGEIGRGDIVTAYFPDEAILMNPDYEGLSIIKRVIAVPGDKIIITKDGVYVNDNLLDETYLTEDNKRATYMADSDYTALLLEDGEYYLMGDNRVVSQDSRVFGVVMEEDILYKQSATITPNFLFKLGIVILLFVIDLFIYSLIEFVLTELAYGLIYGRKIKKETIYKDTNTLKGDSVNVDSSRF